MKDSSKTIIITFSDNKYFSLLKDLILSIKRFPQSKDISIGILDGGLDDDQIEYLKQHTSFIKKSEWEDCLKFASKAAAINCTKEGCYPPTENEIKNFKLNEK